MADTPADPSSTLPPTEAAKGPSVFISYASEDRLAARTSLVSLGILSAGMLVGLAVFDAGDFDVPVAVTLGIWAIGLLVLTILLKTAIAVKTQE